MMSIDCLLNVALFSISYFFYWALIAAPGVINGKVPSIYGSLLNQLAQKNNHLVSESERLGKAGHRSRIQRLVLYTVFTFDQCSTILIRFALDSRMPIHYCSR